MLHHGVLLKLLKSLLLLSPLLLLQGCSAIFRTEVQPIKLNGSAFTTLLKASDRVEVSGAGRFSNSRLAAEDGSFVVEIPSGTECRARAVIPPDAVKNGILDLARIDGELRFSQPVRIREGKRPAVSVDALTLKNEELAVRVLIGRSLVNLLVGSLFGGGGSGNEGTNAVIGRWQIDKLDFALRPGAQIELDSDSRFAVGPDSHIRSNNLSAAYNGDTNEWSYKGSLDVAMNLPVPAEIQLGDNVLLVHRASVTAAFSVAGSSDGSMHLGLSAPVASPWQLQGVQIKQPTGTDVALSQLLLSPSSFIADRASAGTWDWSLSGSARLAESASVGRGGATISMQLASPADVEVGVTHPAQGKSLARIVTKAPLDVASLRATRMAKNESLAVVLDTTKVPVFDVNTNGTTRISVGEGTSIALQRVELLKPNRMMVLTGGSGGVMLTTDKPWTVVSKDNSTTAIIPAGKVATADARIRVIDTDAKGGDVGEVELRNIVFSGTIDQSALLASATLTGKSNGRIELVGIGDVALEASFARIEFIDDGITSKTTIDNASLAIGTRKWPSLLVGKTFDINPDSIKFGDGGDLSPIRNARNTGGTGRITAAPTIAGLSTVSLPVHIEIPLAYDNSHWVFLKKSWQARTGKVTLDGVFTSSFNRIEFVAGESDHRLGAAKLRVKPGRVRLGKASITVKGTGNLKKVLGVGTLVLYGLMQGVLPLPDDTHFDLEISKLGRLPPIVANAATSDVSITNTRIGGEPAIILKFDGVVMRP